MRRWRVHDRQAIMKDPEPQARMTHVTHDVSRFWSGQAAHPVAPRMRLVRAALVVGLAYYIGSWVGFALTLKPSPVSTLWPPNSILLAAFLLTPARTWPALLLGAFVAHLVVQLQSDIPLPMVLGWFVSNSGEGLMGALIIRHYIKGPLRFESFREIGIFVIGATLLGTVLSSFLDAGFVSLAGLGDKGYWDVWLTRSASNVLTSLTLVPVIVTWANGGWSRLRAAPLSRYLEAVLLGGGLLAVCIVVFGGRATATDAAPVLLYAPLPFLIWAALRFGPRGTSVCLLFVAVVAILGAVRGHGPFVTRSPAENALSIQLFLTVFSIPLLALAAVVREREHAEYSARESQERLNLALCASRTGTWEWYIADDAWSMPLQSRQILGLDADEIVTLDDFLQAVSPEDRGVVSQVIRQSVEEGSSYECEFRLEGRDGSVRWVLSQGEIIYNNQGAPERLVAVNVDITERKSAEKLLQEEVTLRESEARFRELADTLPQIIWSARANGQIDYFNRRWYELTGAAVTAADQGWLFMTHPDDRYDILETWYRSVATGEPCEIEYRLRVHATGEYRWHLARAVPVRSRTGGVTRWYGSCTDIEDQKRVEQALRDARLQLEERVALRTAALSSANAALINEITERAAAERALRSSEERFGRAFHSSPDAIVIVRQSDYRFIEVNEKWEAMFGYSRAEALGRSADELGLIVREAERQQGRALLESGGSLREFEMDARTRGGDVFRIALVTDPVDMAGEPCYIIIIRNITERKRAESMLREQQRELEHLSRVAALGEISGALAHELSQPLAAILANARAAQRVMSDRPDLSELREIVEDIAMDDRRASQVIQRLRGLLKKGESQTRLVRIEDVVGEVLSLLHSDLIQRGVSSHTELAAGLPPARADRVQLQQVLLNLVLNACDAMADRRAGDRHLTITTSLTAEGALQLRVSDQGVGIPESRLNKIFEPFMTTKEHGLGLGLAICRSIVAAQGGRMWAANNPAGGATFLVELKPAEAEETGADADKREAGPVSELSPASTR